MRPWSVIAAVTAVVAIGVPVFVPAALVLGLIAYRKSSDRRSRLVAQGAVGLALLVGLAWSTLILVNRAQVSRAHGSAECAAGLQSLLLAQERFRSARHRFADESELGLNLPAARVSFFQSPIGPEAFQLERLKVGRSGSCPDCLIVIACRDAGQWWSISSADRQVGDRLAAAGVPFRH